MNVTRTVIHLIQLIGLLAAGELWGVGSVVAGVFIFLMTNSDLFIERESIAWQTYLSEAIMNLILLLVVIYAIFVVVNPYVAIALGIVTATLKLMQGILAVRKLREGEKE